MVADAEINIIGLYPFHDALGYAFAAGHVDFADFAGAVLRFLEDEFNVREYHNRQGAGMPGGMRLTIHKLPAAKALAIVEEAIESIEHVWGRWEDIDGNAAPVRAVGGNDDAGDIPPDADHEFTGLVLVESGARYASPCTHITFDDEMISAAEKFMARRVYGNEKSRG